MEEGRSWEGGGREDDWMKKEEDGMRSRGMERRVLRVSWSISSWYSPERRRREEEKRRRSGGRSDGGGKGEEEEKKESFRAKQFVRESIFKRGMLRGVRLSLFTISR